MLARESLPVNVVLRAVQRRLDMHHIYGGPTLAPACTLALALPKDTPAQTAGAGSGRCARPPAQTAGAGSAVPAGIASPLRFRMRNTALFGPAHLTRQRPPSFLAISLPSSRATRASPLREALWVTAEMA